jgi:hypothetical protein
MLLRGIAELKIDFSVFTEDDEVGDGVGMMGLET